MERETSTRFWIVTIIGVVGLALLALLFRSVGQEPAGDVEPTASVPVSRSPLSAVPTAGVGVSPRPTATAEAGGQAPASAEFAPGFTLTQGGAGPFVLEERLAQGPVILTFFSYMGG